MRYARPVAKAKGRWRLAQRQTDQSGGRVVEGRCNSAHSLDTSQVDDVVLAA
jgi:hypothetical protein